YFLPKLTRAIPASLVAILAVTALAHGLDLDTRMVGDLASVAGGLPQFHIPLVPLTLDNILIILPYAGILAAIGLIESLMTMSLIDEITETRGRGNKECIGQGAANVVTGFFGGMGGCAMIGQSMINVNSGGRGRLSGIAAALFLLVFIVFASGLIEMIPLAALVGVMFMVVIGTFAWSSFRILHKIPFTDALVLVLVSAVTVATDLAIAVGVGVIVSALVFAWESAKRITSSSSIDESGAKVYRLSGSLFFGSIHSFQEQFTPQEDPDEVIIDFGLARVCDHSGIESINSLTERYLSRGKKLRLKRLSPECRTLLHNAGSMIEVNVIEDPRYWVASDQLA
ncbi:MAG: STAS domain-containing protein, partial [Proteobacteria bacterium]|nr:STAS domain-containing protein [Pseudomonadota bacterium]